MMCGLPFLVRINVSSCVVFVRIFVEFRRLNVGNYVGEGGYCGNITEFPIIIREIRHFYGQEEAAQGE